MKIKEFKNDQIKISDVKPVLKKRGTLVGQHDGQPGAFIKQKTLMANLREDETIDEFPDTRSHADDENSYAY